MDGSPVVVQVRLRRPPFGEGIGSDRSSGHPISGTDCAELEYVSVGEFQIPFIRKEFQTEYPPRLLCLPHLQTIWNDGMMYNMEQWEDG